MKARVKATGEIGIVSQIDVLLKDDFISFSPNNVELMTSYVDCANDKLYDELGSDYWEKLKHQYAGMAMQGLMTLLPNIGGLEGRTPKDEIVDIAVETATALIEKLKEKEEK